MTKTTNPSVMPMLMEELKQSSKPYLQLFVSAITTVTNKKKNYHICFIMDMFSREIVGYSLSKDKNSDLVIAALNSIKYELSNCKVLHTDNNSNYNNPTVMEWLEKKNITLSLSTNNLVGNPYAKSLIKSFKIEYCDKEVCLTLRSLANLDTLVTEFVEWYNQERLHSSLDYMSPQEFLLKVLSKIS